MVRPRECIGARVQLNVFAYTNNMPITENCKNCDTPMQGSFCHNCGQKRVDFQRPLTSLIAEPLRDTFDVDGRLARTLVTLITRPGVLTQSYLAGRRQYFTPPLRLYLVVSLLFFILVAWLARQGIFFEVTANTTDEIQVLSEQLPKMMFLCLPLFALLLKLLYFQHYYFDHLVHALHLHTAAYLALAVMLPFERLAEESLLLLATQLFAFGYMVIYLLISQRSVYQSGWTITLAKTAAIFFAYSILLGVLIETASSLEAAGGISNLL